MKGWITVWSGSKHPQGSSRPPLAGGSAPKPSQTNACAAFSWQPPGKEKVCPCCDCSVARQRASVNPASLIRATRTETKLINNGEKKKSTLTSITEPWVIGSRRATKGEKKTLLPSKIAVFWQNYKISGWRESCRFNIAACGKAFETAPYKMTSTFLINTVSGWHTRLEMKAKSDLFC